MKEVTTLLQSALDDEPPLGFAPADILDRAHAARRRRRGFALAGTSCMAAVLVALALVLSGSPNVHSPRVAPALSLVALERTAAAHAAEQPPRRVGPAVRVEGISSDDLAALVEQDTGVTLDNVNIGVLPPDQVIDLSAAIDVTGQPYLNVQVAPAHTMTTATPTCSELSDLNSGDGDGFYGPCSITTLADGSRFVVRSGRTSTGGFTMAQALLVSPDGSGIFAENTNQTATAPRLAWFRGSATDRHASQVPPAVRPLPVLDSEAMATLVLDLSKQGGS
jgi:hypothetical protein